MSDYVIQLLRKLIAIDSVNPSLVPGGAGEKEIADAVAKEMRGLGLDVHVTEVERSRPNVIGVMTGRSKGRSLMLCGHLDTVGVVGMEAPFDPVVRDGRVYGRGAQDMKGGLAAMIAAARTISMSGGLKSGRLILAGVIDEEYASLGASALVQQWQSDGAVITEPTDLLVAVAHKGYSWIEITTQGRAAHGSRPSEGRDAILRMGRVLYGLEALDRAIQSRSPHPLLGTGSLHASLIQGGRELSTYPDSCAVQMERRLLSDETAADSLREVEEILRQLKENDPEFHADAKLLFAQPPYEIPFEHDLPALLEAAVGKVGHRTRRAGMTYWTDAAILGKAGIPSVIFGPGGAGLHGIEEYVLVDEVLACHNALVELIPSFCA